MKQINFQYNTYEQYIYDKVRYTWYNSFFLVIYTIASAIIILVITVYVSISQLMHNQTIK